MKAALIGGEFHGQAIVLPGAVREMYLPASHRTEPVDEQPYDPFAESGLYRIEPRYLIKTDRGIELAIYTHRLTSISNPIDTEYRVQALHMVARILGPDVGLNRWLDAELEARLSTDADLQRRLFALRGPFTAES